MNADRWREITRIYGAVAVRPPHERAEAMLALCGDDRSLHQEIESLLDESIGPPMVLDQPPWEIVAGVITSDLNLTPGTHVGPYRIVGLLGVGGMGEVYRARDTKLNRDVAIKVLPTALAAEPDRLSRFRREAQVLASLNHPNIGAIYGLEEQATGQGGGTPGFLVMELVEGEDLALRIERGPMRLDEALPIARQISEALEAAHERGIIHRDLKPANIKLREDGAVKVLDFGLAKFTDAGAAGRPGRATGGLQTSDDSPTITASALLRQGPNGQAMTAAGMILGTPAYMSPEQAKGRPADKRSDIWAFGCVLFEMLTGSRPFKGDNFAEVLAGVLKDEPDWQLLPLSLPPVIRGLIRGCLRRDRKERIGDISVALFVLRDPSTTGPATLFPTSPPSNRGRAMLIGALGVFVGLAVAAAFWYRDPSLPALVSRFTLTMPAGQQLTLNRPAVAVSPDGRRIVYSADAGLFLRVLSDFEARPIPGAKPGINPVFSPDGESLAFYAPGELTIKRISVGGGTPVVICRVTLSPTSLAWAGDSILFSDAGNAIMRVPAAGGKPEAIIDFETSGDRVYGPQLLPDGDTLLFGLVKRAVAALDRWDSSVVVQSLRTGHRTLIAEHGGDARYAPTGHIVYVNDGTLFAVPFELSTLKVTGPPVPVVDGISLRATTNIGSWAQYALSSAGSLVYVPSLPTAQNLLLVNPQGVPEVLNLPPGKFEYPRVSPDGTRIAVGTIVGNESAVSIYDLSGSRAARRITLEGNNRFPVWSGDSKRVAFQSDRDGDHAIFSQPADGGAAVRLTHPEPGVLDVPESWSPDGKVLLYSSTRELLSSLRMLSLIDGKTAPFGSVTDSSLPTDAVFSPDGHWVAYQTAKGTLVEGTTYVEAFPSTGDIHEVAQGGRPLWSRDGRQLFFVPAADRFMAVGVTTTPVLSFTPPVAVPRRFAIAVPTAPRSFDLLSDGRFLVVGAPGDSDNDPRTTTAQIRVVVNWFEDLKRLAPMK